MTHAEFKTLMGTVMIPNTETPLPSAYYEFESPVSLPFICFYFPYRNDVYADNLNYQTVEHAIVELYTDRKDFAQESELEEVLFNAEIAYIKNPSAFITSERMWQTIYEFDYVLTEESNA